jgi:high affinity sulfate transporter 1
MARETGRGEKPLYRHLPIAGWLPTYERKWLYHDTVAGLTVWALMVPTAMAYAVVAGVPVEYGLYAAALALVAYAVLGTSRQVVTGPMAAVAAISAAVVTPVAAGRGLAVYIALSAVLALLVGALFILAGLFRLGFIASFLAKPVLRGLIVALVIFIMVGQADKLVGVEATGGNTFARFADIFRQLGAWSWLTLAVGAGCLTLLFLLKKFAPRIPASLTVMVLAIIFSSIFNLAEHGVQVVGEVPSGLPAFSLAGVTLNNVIELIPGALAILLVGYAISIAVAKTYADKHHYRIDANQEMIALGAANLGSGFLQGFAVVASLTKTAANDEAGGKTPLVLVVCSILTFLTLFLLTGLLRDLPDATLGAIVIYVLWDLVDFNHFKRYYRVSRTDMTLALVSFFSVLIAGIVPGVIIGVLLSLAVIVNRVRSPHTALLGQDVEGVRYGDLREHPDYEEVPGVIIYRFDAPLIFPNAERLSDDILQLVDESDRVVKTVIIGCEMMYDMDTTATDTLIELISTLNDIDIEVLLARVHARVRTFIRRDTAALEIIREENIFPTVRDAMAAFKQRYPSPDKPDNDTGGA